MPLTILALMPTFPGDLRLWGRYRICTSLRLGGLTVSIAVSPSTLEGERILLVPPDTEYAGDLFMYGSDPLFHEFIGSAPFIDVSQAEAFIKSLRADNLSGRRCYWLIVEKESGQAVGTLGFNFLFNPEFRAADFGYGLASFRWNRSIFRAAAQLVIEFGFTVLQLERIQVMTRADNLRSIRGVERLGFCREATLRKYCRIAGERKDCAVFGLLRENWVQPSWSPCIRRRASASRLFNFLELVVTYGS
jgi:[ribosomal protein S5]-alanine N-acetyltransferase